MYYTMHMDNKLLIHIKEKLINIMPYENELDTGFFGIKFYRRNNVDLTHICVQKPCIFFVVNGEKHINIGSKDFFIEKGYYNITYIDYPVSSYFSNISESNPYLSIYLPVDNKIISEIIKDIDNIPNNSFKGISSHKAEENLLEAYERLVDLYKSHDNNTFLAELTLKEIYYRILTGPAGADLKSLFASDSQSNKIYKAVEYITENYKDRLTINDIAAKVNMAPSTFFRVFKQITLISPLQYQKRLRLYEAQRLMLAESLTATEAAYNVGYESITQFTREYKKIFNSSPAKNIKSILKGKPV